MAAWVTRLLALLLGGLCAKHALHANAQSLRRQQAPSAPEESFSRPVEIPRPRGSEGEQGLRRHALPVLGEGGGDAAGEEWDESSSQSNGTGHSDAPEQGDHGSQDDHDHGRFEDGKEPTGQPAARPNNGDDPNPTAAPSTLPTGHPTDKLHSHPTGQPTGQPNRQPNCQPTGQSTGLPTSQPTGQPIDIRLPLMPLATVLPTGEPTALPTSEPLRMSPSPSPAIDPQLGFGSISSTTSAPIVTGYPTSSQYPTRYFSHFPTGPTATPVSPTSTALGNNQINGNITLTSAPTAARPSSARTKRPKTARPSHFPSQRPKTLAPS